MSNPKDMTLERAELVAFTFFETLLASGELRGTLSDAIETIEYSATAGADVVDAGSMWRDKAAVRSASRGLSTALVAALEAAQFNLKHPPDKVVASRVTDIMTSPAFRAYDLDSPAEPT